MAYRVKDPCPTCGGPVLARDEAMKNGAGETQYTYALYTCERGCPLPAGFESEAV